MSFDVVLGMSLAILVVLSVLFVPAQKAAFWSNAAISDIINVALPTVPYRWPNGQGNVEKFMHGKENSIKWRQRYGSIYRIWSGMKSEVVLTKPEHIQAVFKDSDKHSKALNNNSGYFFSQLLGECQGLVNHDTWRRVRNVTEQTFVQTKTSTYTSLVVGAVTSHFVKMTACKSGIDVLDPVQDFRMLPLWIVATIIYGKLDTDLEAKLSSIAILRDTLFNKALQGGLVRFQWSRFLPTADNKNLAGFKKAWADFNAQAYQTAIARGSHDLPIVTMFDQVTPNGCTEENLLQTIDEMLFANLDVTLGGLTWNFVQLAVHTETQEKLRTEGIQPRKSPQQLKAYLNSTSNYLHAVVVESSRLRPLAAFTVPQSAPTVRELDGWLIPAGTDFVVDSYSLNQLDEVWGPDGFTFRPERFHSLPMTRTRYNFWRFGFGPRQCMGRHVADLIIKAILWELLRVFDIRLINQDQEWKRDDGVWIDHPDLKLRCIKRN